MVHVIVHPKLSVMRLRAGFIAIALALSVGYISTAAPIPSKPGVVTVEKYHPVMDVACVPSYIQHEFYPKVALGHVPVTVSKLVEPCRFITPRCNSPGYWST